ncbi:prenyltransferase [Dietzia sp. SYD-A1]|uniref:prenyltransferase n=1 Tax=unclassified Dietzia TaxID=2617939 RepID=UPI000D2161C2|nr:prenyltransferase [Dietzia sp. SYD-A1]AVZ40136.1 prenyltransferase [Dietzia sp. JS16-p6b]QGW25569.1 lycopene beta-elongase BC [Dietzia sp. DQ12-45-1b]
MTSLYTTLNLTMSIPVVAVALLAAWRLRGQARRRWLIGVAGAFVILMILTAVFDNIMISAGLVAYDDELTSGIRLGVAPIEDFAYAVAAAVFVPSVWALLTESPRVGAGVGNPTVSGRGDALLARGPGHDDDEVRTPERSPSPGLLSTLFWSSRPVSWINTAAPFALAYFLATGGFDLVGVIGTVFFLVPYNLAMYGINDVFDYESDLRNPRKGGVEGSVLERSRHTATLVASAVTTVPFLLYLVLVGSLESSLWLAASAFAVIAYSARGLRFKEIPFLDSVTSAFHFVSPAIVGWTIAGAELTGGVWACLVAFMLWGAASQAFGAVQDVRFDREADLKSVATVLGARAAVWFALACYAAAVIVLLVAAPWPASGAAFAILPYLATVAAYVGVTDADAERTNEGWKRFLVLNMLAGFCVTQIILWSVLVWS